MKRLMLVLTVIALISTPVLAVPTIEFSGSSAAGGWTFDASTDTFTFGGGSQIDAVQGGTSDPLVGSGYVWMPDLLVSGSSSTGWIVDGGTITISDSAGTTDYLTGILGAGDLQPSGTTVGAYTIRTRDISWSNMNNTISSPVVDAMWDNGEVDFDLTLQGAAQDDFESEYLMTNSGSTGNGLSGSMTMTVPAPGAILLGGIGVGLVGWFRKRNTL